MKGIRYGRAKSRTVREKTKKNSKETASIPMRRERGMIMPGVVFFGPSKKRNGRGR